jgi:Leucine-rich repeat (LRR) protein
MTREMVRPLDPPCEVVQFNSLPSDKDLLRLAELMERHPDVALRAYGGYDGTIDNLEFLRFFPQLRRFHADALRYREFNDIDGLRYLPENLVELTLGRTRRRFSLAPLSRFRSLRRLYLEGNPKDVDVISTLTMLEDLTLRSLTLPDLSILLPLRRLRSLDIKLGGTRDLGLLPELAPLAYLELWMIRGLEDISPVAELASLQYLFLQDLARIDRLPDLSRMTSLRRIDINGLKRLTDLSPLLSAPALEELYLVKSAHLRPEHLECLVGHPTLRAAAIALGSKRKDAAADKLLPLPRPGTFAFRT